VNTAEIREENLTAHAAEILVNITLTILQAAIYCTVVAGNTAMVLT